MAYIRQRTTKAGSLSTALTSCLCLVVEKEHIKILALPCPAEPCRARPSPAGPCQVLKFREFDRPLGFFRQQQMQFAPQWWK
jgi:hypothetical protein